MSASKDKLAELHALLASILADRIGGEEATAADLNVARQFLKDNGITSVLEHDKDLQRITDKLPFTSTDDFGLAN